MKKQNHWCKLLVFLLLSVVACLPFSAFASSDIDLDEAKAQMNAALSYKGMSVRQSGDASGIRSLWEIDQAKVAELERAGYTVTYGALMGVGTSGDRVIREDARSLAVEKDALRGYTVKAEKASLVVVYATDAPAYASQIYTDINGDVRQFAYTTLLGEGYEEERYYDMKLVARAFYVLEHQTYGSFIGYVDKSESTLPESVSLSDVADYLYQNVELYKANRAILRVVAFKKSSVTVASVGASVAVLSDGSYKLPADSNTNAGISNWDNHQPAFENALTLSVSVPADGFYRVTAKVNREGAYVKRIYIRMDNSHLSIYSLGKSTDTLLSNPDYAAADGERVTIGYIRLPKGGGTATLSSSAAVGISELELLPVDLPIAEDGSSIVIGARTQDNNHSTGNANLFPSGYTSNGASQYATYAVTPAKSGIYTVAMLARLQNGNPVVTVTDSAGNLVQAITTSLASAQTTYPATAHQQCTGYVPMTGDIRMRAGESYSIKIGMPNGGRLDYYFVLLQHVGTYTEDTLELLPQKNGMYELSLNAPESDSYTLLLDGREVASLTGNSDSTAVSQRSFGEFYLDAYRKYSFTLLKNGEPTSTMTLRSDFISERNDNYVDITTADGGFVYEQAYAFTLTQVDDYFVRLSHASDGTGTVSYTILSNGTSIAEGAVALKAGDTASVGDVAHALSAGEYQILLSGTMLPELTAVSLSPKSGDRHYSTLQGSTDVSFVKDGVAFIPSKGASTDANRYTYSSATYTVINAGDFIGMDTAMGVPLECRGMNVSITDTTTAPSEYIGIKFVPSVTGTYAVRLRFAGSAYKVLNFRYAITEANQTPGSWTNTGTWNYVYDASFKKLAEKLLYTDKNLTAGQEYTLYIANIGTYTPRIWGIYLDMTETHSPVEASPVGEVEITAFEATVSVHTTGNYRLSLALNAAEKTDIVAAFARDGELFTEVATVTDVVGSTTVLLPETFSMSYGERYHLRLALGSAELWKASFDLAEASETVTVWYHTAKPDLTGVNASNIVYQKTGAVTYDIDVDNYGMPSDTPYTVYVKQYSDKGTPPYYDPYPTSIRVPISGNYVLRVLYTHTVGASAAVAETATDKRPALAMYWNGTVTPSSDATEAAAHYGGTWSVGESGESLVANSGGLSGGFRRYVYTYDAPLHYYTAGDHTLWMQNLGTWGVYVLGVQMIPASAELQTAVFSSDITDVSTENERVTVKLSTDCAGFESLSYTATAKVYDLQNNLLATKSAVFTGSVDSGTIEFDAEIASYAYVTVDFQNTFGTLGAQARFVIDYNALYPKYHQDSAAFKDQTALFLGDSITYASVDGASSVYRSWAGRIGLATGMTVTNNGFSGASLSTIRDSRIITQYTKLSDTQKASFNYVILHGGINDATSNAAVGAPSSVSVGDFTDTTLSAEELNTYAGALEQLFYTVTKGSPNAKIGYIINFQVPSYRNGATEKVFQSYIETAKEVCEKWNIPYLNLHDDAAFTERFQPDTATHLYDYLHPNGAGYDLLYKYIMVWMEEKLPVYSESKSIELETLPTDLAIPES